VGRGVRRALGNADPVAGPAPAAGTGPESHHSLRADREQPPEGHPNRRLHPAGPP